MSLEQVVKSVSLNALGSPHPDKGGMLEVRFTNDNGDTEVWMVPNKHWGPECEGFLEVMQGVEAVKLAFIDSGVDTRIGLLVIENERLRKETGGTPEA